MWVRTDDLIIRHPKILAVGEHGAYFYWASLVYAAQYRTDGFIPKEALPAIAPVSDFEERAHLLVTARAPGYENGLWEEAPGGYVIHDYLDYQPSAASLKKREQADRERLRAARERGAVGGTSRSRANDPRAETSLRAGDADSYMEEFEAPLPPASTIRTPTEPRRGRREPPSRSTRAPAGNVDAHVGEERAPASAVTRQPAADAAEPRRNDVAARSLRSRRVPSPSPSPFPNPERSQDPDRVCAPDPRATAREEHTHTGGGDEFIAERPAPTPEPGDVERLPSATAAAELDRHEPSGPVDAHAGAERTAACTLTHRPGAHAAPEPRRSDVAARSLRSRRVPSPSPNPDRSQDPDRVSAPDPRATACEEHTHTGVGDEILAERSAEAPARRDVGRLPGAFAAAEPRQREPVPASTRPPEAAPKDTDEITALQVLELLRALPAPMCHLATLENAKSFAMARNLGLALTDIRSAITAAAVKVGKHRNAGPEEPQTLVALAQHVGTFIVNQRPAVVAATSPRATADAPADAAAVDKFLSRWRELYAQTEGITYTVTDEDREHAAELVGLIAQAVREHAAKPGVDAAGLEERIAERWMRRYLRDEGVNAYLVKVRHALRYMKRGVATYGLPQGPARGSVQSAVTVAAPAPMSAAESAACGDAVLRKLAGGPGPAKVERPSEAARKAAG